MNVKSASQTKLGERTLYGSYFLGQNIIYWLVTSYLMFFYTNKLGINPLIVSGIFIVAKVWDAINDPLFGAIMDKSHLKRGKFKPWILVSTIGLPLITFLMFVIPAAFPMWLKIVLAFLTYFIWDILYTVGDVPVFALTTVMTNNTKERANIVTIGRFGAMLGGFVLSTFLVPLFDKDNGFFIVGLIMMVCCYLTMFPICIFAKERFEAPQKKNDDFKIREVFKYIKNNTNLMLFFIAFIVWGCFEIAMGPYVLTYCFGTFKYASYQTIVSVVPTLVMYALMPLIIKKVDKMKVYIVSCVLIIVMNITQYFVGYHNQLAYLVIYGLRGFAATARGILMFTFAADCLEFGQFKSGIRKEGATFAVQTFSAKFAAAIAAALTGVILFALGLSGDVVVEGSVAFSNKVWAVSNLVPLIGSIISIPVLCFYKLTDKKVQIMSDCNAEKITREEAESLLGELK